MNTAPGCETEANVQRLREAQRAADAGHRVDDLPIGRTQVYALLAEGKLKARKMGRATIITNWPEYLASLPVYKQAA